MNAAISPRDGAVWAAAPLADSTADKAAADVNVASVAVDLYARMTARDLAGVLRYISPAGFTEISPSTPSVHVLTPAAFEMLFNSDAMIQLRAEDVNAQRLGSTALVTGVRVGSIGPKDKPATAARVPFTMAWVNDDGNWQLRHIH